MSNFTVNSNPTTIIDLNGLTPGQIKQLQTIIDDFKHQNQLEHPHSKDEETSQKEEKSLYEKFAEIGLIGCCSVEENLSATYKEVLANTLVNKYDHS